MAIKAKGSSYCAVKVTVIVFLLVLGLTVVSTTVEDVSRAVNMDLSSSNVQGTPLASLAEGLPTFDLTGTWKSDDGGTYYIRQIGNKVSWLGESDSWSNVAYGSILGDIISLEWMDVPKNDGYGSGMLALRIDSEDKMTALDRTGGFAGSTWSREMFLVPSDPIEVTPIPIPGPVAMQEPSLNPEVRSDFSSDLVSVAPIPLP